MSPLRCNGLSAADELSSYEGVVAAIAYRGPDRASESQQSRCALRRACSHSTASLGKAQCHLNHAASDLLRLAASLALEFSACGTKPVSSLRGTRAQSFRDLGEMRGLRSKTSTRSTTRHSRPSASLSSIASEGAVSPRSKLLMKGTFERQR